MPDYYIWNAKVICLNSAADLEKLQNQRASELQRLRYMHVIYTQ